MDGKVLLMRISLGKGDASGLIQERIRFFEKEEIIGESYRWEDLHRVCLEQWDFDSLTRLYEATLQRNPYRWWLSYRLGDIYKSSGKFNQAIDSYERANRLHPDYFHLRVRRGKIHEV
jgi:tetratricopeptide (TPR) repeat protein